MTTDSIEKLGTDLNILEQMVSETAAYLKSDLLFWPMEKGNMPQLTFGGLFLRLHRLNGAHRDLTIYDKHRIEQAEQDLKKALSNHVVRFEQRIHEELNMRLRNWEQFLRDYKQEEKIATFYATKVEIRTMIELLIEQMQQAPYKLDPTIPERLNMLDTRFRNSLPSGSFVWSTEWTEAYPQERFWWLYA